MKKIISLLTILILIFSFPVFAANKTDFRNVKWGMTTNEVIKSESLPLWTQEKNYLFYKTEISKLPCLLLYSFTNNKLYGAGYSFQQSHTNLNDHIYDFGEIKNLLTKKYGNPKDHQVIWKNNLYKNSEEDWGFAISLGHLEVFTTWETETSNIELELYGDNYEISHVLRYKSKSYENYENEIAKDQLEDL